MADEIDEHEVPLSEAAMEHIADRLFDMQREQIEQRARDRVAMIFGEAPRSGYYDRLIASIERVPMSEISDLDAKIKSQFYDGAEMFDGDAACTTRCMAFIYGTDAQGVLKAYKENEHRFVDGEHFVRLSSAGVKEFNAALTDDDFEIAEEPAMLWRLPAAFVFADILGPCDWMYLPYDPY